jgi:TPR repeat protein
LIQALKILVTLAAISAAVSASAGTLEEGKQAYLAQDYAKAFEILQPLAEQGQPDAQLTLGIMYDYGQGVPQDNAKALEWYRKAALHGSPSVQHNLGVKYFDGIGIPRNYLEAYRWWRMAAAAGFAESQYSLGELYASGLGVAKDESQAAKWYRLAADQNNAMAQYRLGVMYAAGRGVSHDYAQAYRWLRKAADQGLPQAQYQVGRLYENGVGISRNEREALRWYQLAADQGLDKARIRLGGLQQRSSSRAAQQATVDRKPDESVHRQSPSRDLSAAESFATNAGEQTLTRRDDWIRSQPPERFTLQLVTASSEQSVADLIARGGLGANTAYFRRSLNGGVGYTLVHGVYASKLEAQDALASLPTSFQKSKPWVRSFADIQALLQP